MALFNLNYNSGLNGTPVLAGKVKWFMRHPETSFWLALKSNYTEAVCLRANEIINAPIKERTNADGMARTIFLFEFPRELAIHCHALERDIEEYVLNCLNEAGLI